MNDSAELDLHGVRARDARAHVVRFVQSVRLATPGATVRIVTGLGLHSKASPVLHKLVRQMLESKTVPHVAEWSMGPEGASFIVRLTRGDSPQPPSRRAAEPPRPSDREWLNSRQLEYARRCAEREQAAAAEAAEEARRLAALRREHGGKELPEWLCLPPAAVLEARAARARAEADDRVEYARTRADVESAQSVREG